MVAAAQNSVQQDIERRLAAHGNREDIFEDLANEYKIVEVERQFLHQVRRACQRRCGGKPDRV